MANITVSSVVHSLMQSADAAAAQSALGIGLWHRTSDFLVIDPVNGADDGDGTLTFPVRTLAQAATLADALETVPKGVLFFPGDAGLLDLNTTSWRPHYWLGACGPAANWMPTDGQLLGSEGVAPDGEIRTKAAIRLHVDETDHLHLLSNHGVVISIESPAGGRTGEVGPEIVAHNVMFNTVSAIGAVGANGADGEPGANGGFEENGQNGTPGMPGEKGAGGGILKLIHCVCLGEITCTPGNGGAGGDGGDGGNAGETDQSGGSGGDGGAGGGAGDGGTVESFSSFFLQPITVSAGTGGAGGTGGFGGGASGGGSPGSDGANGAGGSSGIGGTATHHFSLGPDL